MEAGVFSGPDFWRTQSAAGTRGAQMLLLHPVLGARIRNHSFGQDFVIVELALQPPLILISYHAPSNAAGPEQYDLSLSILVDELVLIKNRSQQGTRLVLCTDLNTQLNANPPHYRQIHEPW